MATPTELIDAKYNERKQHGLDLGAPKGPAKQIGSGGWVREYDGGNIYWHQNTGAHEVGGGILAKYLQHGGPGVHPKTGKRELGYPTKDSSKSLDGLYPVSQFEWGIVSWVQGSGGGVAIFGNVFKRWQSLKAELGVLGHPVTDPVPVPGGQATFFQRGCIVNPPGASQLSPTSILMPPPLGRPAVAGTADQHQLLFRLSGERPSVMTVDWSQIWNDKLILIPTKMTPSQPIIPLSIDQMPANLPGTHIGRCLATSALQDRTLYDICLRLPVGKNYVLAPHSVYAKKDWSTFGFIHATDLHVSRRIDSYKRVLMDAGREEAAAELSDFNAKTRALVQDANLLFDKGDIDFVLATGDLVDYMFEDSDDPEGGGNFRLFEDLIMGRAKAPGQDAPDAALHAPIFTSLGNHDYRVHPYMLGFDLNVTGSIADSIF